MTGVNLVVDTLSLSFASLNLVLLLSILSKVTSIAEAPKAWNLLTIGLSLVILRFSVEVFLMVNSSLDFAGLQLVSAFTSVFGFSFMFWGIYRIWEVMYS